MFSWKAEEQHVLTLLEEVHLRSKEMITRKSELKVSYKEKPSLALHIFFNTKHFVHIQR